MIGYNIKIRYCVFIIVLLWYKSRYHCKRICKKSLCQLKPQKINYFFDQSGSVISAPFSFLSDIHLRSYILCPTDLSVKNKNCIISNEANFNQIPYLRISDRLNTVWCLVNGRWTTGAAENAVPWSKICTCLFRGSRC